ncbi:MAG: prephenate dehydrogenase/arogenate dehydrogenase family protein [Gemmatimonadaceae bacterium]
MRSKKALSGAKTSSAARLPEPLAAPTRVAILGLGVIGGSLARALAARGVPVVAYADSTRDREAASAAGIDVASTRGAAVSTVGSSANGVVVLALPLLQVAPVAREILPIIASGTLILHTVGLQSSRALDLDGSQALRIIGAHPLAGSHASGFAAARPDLFHDAEVSIEARATPVQRVAIEQLWGLAGAARFSYRESAEHDARMSWISHLPQIAATAIAATLHETGIPLSAVGPGARDTTRLAASPLSAWEDILLAAPSQTVAALVALEGTVRAVRRALEDGDGNALEDVWENASDWRAAR